MAGFADINAATPTGATNANQIDDEISGLKQDILDGLRGPDGMTGLDDGSTTAAHQGMLQFEVAGSDPAAADRPAGYVYVRTTSLSPQTSRLRRNVSSSSWTNIGLWLKELVGTPFSDEPSPWASQLVNSGSEATITVETEDASPAWYLPDATITGSTHVVALSAPDNTTFSSSTANVWVWIEKSKSTGNVELHIYNNTGTNYTVSYAVAKLMWN